MAQNPKDFIRGARQTLDNQTDVSLALAKHLLLNYGKNLNLVFSPISIQVLLSLLASGSSGETLDQLLSFLQAKSSDELNHLYSYLVDLVFVDGSLSGGPCLSFANGVWIDKTSSFKPSFKQVVDTFYKADAYQVDFKNKEEPFYSLSSIEKNYSLSMAQNPKDFIRGNRLMLDNQTDVSLALAKHLLLNYGKNSNLVFSPISIQVLLSLLASGSSGETLDQLLSFLKAKSSDELNHLYSYLVDLVFVDGSLSGGPCLSFANGVWIEQTSSLKPCFKQVLDIFYKADAYQVDFKNKAEEAGNSVNSWVEKETNGLVKKILSSDSLNEFTRLVFANALYFNGKWANVFDADDTENYDFHFLNGDSIQVPFMTMWQDMQYIRVFDSFKVLKLPYSSVVWRKKSDEEKGRSKKSKLGNNKLDEDQFWYLNSDEERGDWKRNRDEKRDFSMYIFLPDAKDGLPALVEKAGSEAGFLERHIPTYAVDAGELRIPKFKFEHQIELSKALQTLGIVLPFDPEVGLSEIVDVPFDPENGPMPLFVSKLFHKSCIEVNEGGTIAAAACASMEEDGAPCCLEEVIKIDFVADHPFLFFIREDNTGMVQFIGHVLNPSET